MQASETNAEPQADEGTDSTPVRLWLATAIVFAVALAALVPTTGDFGLTWDEPAYRYSQVVSAQWWEQWPGAVVERRSEDPRSRRPALLLALCAVRHQFPPAAGRSAQPADVRGVRRLDEGHPGASDGVGDRIRADDRDRLSLSVAAVRSGRRAGDGGSLLLMPRLYGQAHLIDTDMPGLLLWAATALCSGKGCTSRTPGAGGCWSAC